MTKSSKYLFFILFENRLRFKDMKGKSAKKSTDWIMEKKEKRKKQGKLVIRIIYFLCI